MCALPIWVFFQKCYFLTFWNIAAERHPPPPFNFRHSLHGDVSDSQFSICRNWSYIKWRKGKFISIHPFLKKCSFQHFSCTYCMLFTSQLTYTVDIVAVYRIRRFQLFTCSLRWSLTFYPANLLFDNPKLIIQITFLLKRLVSCTHALNVWHHSDNIICQFEHYGRFLRWLNVTVIPRLFCIHV